MLTFAVARPTPTHHRFAFGGVAFKIEAEADVSWQLSPEFARFAPALSVDAWPRDQGTWAGRVACSVFLDPALQGDASYEIDEERNGDRSRLTAAELRAELRAVSPGNYSAMAHVAPRVHAARPQGPDAVVLALSVAILEREGGLSLHAAAVELDGHAVLFLGPSGAGKSTAARLTSGSRVFAFDRVSLARTAHPSRTGYAAYSLPGGDAVDVPRSSQRQLPLAAIFRVRQAREQARVARLTPAQAVFAVRESIWLSDMSPEAEEARFDAAARLVAQVPVAEIHTVLGQSHTELVRQVAWPSPAKSGAKDACHGSV
jgi:hypothetical protein